MTSSRKFAAKAWGFIAAGLLVACKPDAMSYCRALETRELAKECKYPLLEPALSTSVAA